MEGAEQMDGCTLPTYLSELISRVSDPAVELRSFHRPTPVAKAILGCSFWSFRHAVFLGGYFERPLHLGWCVYYYHLNSKLAIRKTL